jgi:hypothetical protein
LHHANFTSATGDFGTAGRFLECDGGEEDGWDAGLGSHGLEHGEVWGARSEGVAILLENGGEIFVNEVVERDGGWDPTVTVHAAVEPVLIAIGTSILARLFSSIGATAFVTVCLDNSAVSSRSWLW